MNKMVFVDEIPESKVITYDDLYHLLKIKKVYYLSGITLNFKRFWENIDNFGCKEYVFIRAKFINNRVVYTEQERFKIKCMGGEYMSKEKPKMIFVDKVPTKHGGRGGYDIEAMLKQIPEGKYWKVSSEDHPSIATIREYIKKNELPYEAVQRTENTKVFLFVSKVKSS